MSYEKITNDAQEILKVIMDVYKKERNENVFAPTEFLMEKCNLTKEQVTDAIFVLKDDMKWIKPSIMGHKQKFTSVKLLDIAEINKFLLCLDQKR